MQFLILMAKKFIILTVQNRAHKLYSQDIRKVHKAGKRQLPSIPCFYLPGPSPSPKAYCEDTEESCL